MAAESSNIRCYAALAAFIVLTQATGFLGALATTPAVPTWYAGLARPSLAPPNWVFGPVWTTLYVLMAVAAWLIWRLPPSPQRRTALVLFALQLALNTLWSFLFFGAQRIDLALVEVVLLLAAIVATTRAYAGLSRIAAWLMAPYIAWVAFATLLNFQFWRLNG